MRKFLARVVAAIAGFVYQRGVDLYRLSDRLDGWDGKTPELPQVEVWYGDNKIKTGGVKTSNVSWTVSSPPTFGKET